MENTKRNLRRTKHYALLVQAGYDSKFATKLKDYNSSTIIELCKIKRTAQLSLDEIDQNVQLEIERVLGGKGK